MYLFFYWFFFSMSHCAVSCAISSTAQYLFYQDKYKACVVKIQLGCTFLLDVIIFSGPHFGIESDGQLGIDHVSTLPLAPWERLLADGPYYVCDKLICPHRKQRIPGTSPPRFANLTPREIVENNLQSNARSPIEHVSKDLL